VRSLIWTAGNGTCSFFCFLLFFLSLSRTSPFAVLWLFTSSISLCPVLRDVVSAISRLSRRGRARCAHGAACAGYRATFGLQLRSGEPTLCVRGPTSSRPCARSWHVFWRRSLRTIRISLSEEGSNRARSPAAVTSITPWTLSIRSEERGTLPIS